MYGITEAAQELQEYYNEETPLPVYKDDYVKLIVRAIKKFYVDINHPGEYDRTLYTTDDDNNLYYNHDFALDEDEYIWILSKIGYKRKIMSDVTGDGAISYTTDALSVTGAKEGYKSIQQEIDDLENERRIVFNKMTRYTLPSN